MFYFTCNESKIYESFTFWNNLQEKMNFFIYLYTLKKMTSNGDSIAKVSIEGW